MFGEVALFGKTPRPNTATTSEKTELWGMKAKTFQAIMSKLNKGHYAENLQFINSVPLFNKLTNQEKDALISTLNVHEYKDGA
jgi:hypothetical protein